MKEESKGELAADSPFKPSLNPGLKSTIPPPPSLDLKYLPKYHPILKQSGELKHAEEAPKAPPPAPSRSRPLEIKQSATERDLLEQPRVESRPLYRQTQLSHQSLHLGFYSNSQLESKKPYQVILEYNLNKRYEPPISRKWQPSSNPSNRSHAQTLHYRDVPQFRTARDNYVPEREPLREPLRQPLYQQPRRQTSHSRNKYREYPQAEPFCRELVWPARNQRPRYKYEAAFFERGSGRARGEYRGPGINRSTEALNYPY